MTITATAASSAAGVTDVSGTVADALRRISDRFAAARGRRRLAAALRGARRRRSAHLLLAHYRDNFAVGAFGRLA